MLKDIAANFFIVRFFICYLLGCAPLHESTSEAQAPNVAKTEAVQFLTLSYKSNRQLQSYTASRFSFVNHSMGCLEIAQVCRP